VNAAKKITGIDRQRRGQRIVEHIHDGGRHVGEG
jgi:hypothetical protein